MTLEVGDAAPAVSAPNQSGEPVEPAFESPTVVYFYPRDDTPGCTVEARQFEAEREAYRAAGVDVYGVSTDGVDSHRDFAESYGLGFDLLADTDGEIAEAFGVAVDPASGKTERTTVVLADGRVHRVYPGVDPDGHARRVLDDLVDDGLVNADG